MSKSKLKKLMRKEEPKIEEVTPVVVEEKPMEPPKPVVPLKVFLQVFGMKWDQMAGFKYYATKQKLEPLTIEEWRKAFADFMNKPTQ